GANGHSLGAVTGGKSRRCSIGVKSGQGASRQSSPKAERLRLAARQCARKPLRLRLVRMIARNCSGSRRLARGRRRVDWDARDRRRAIGHQRNLVGDAVRHVLGRVVDLAECELLADAVRWKRRNLAETPVDTGPRNTRWVSLLLIVAVRLVLGEVSS